MNYEETLNLVLESKNFKNFDGFSAASEIKYTGIGLRQNNFGHSQVFWMKDGKFHNLNGPAIVEYYDLKSYYIDNRMMSKETYYSHPLVIQYKLDKILEL